jgi:hypothetical protein
MSETVIVVGTYLVSYALIIGYAASLYQRRRRTGG